MKRFLISIELLFSLALIMPNAMAGQKQLGGGAGQRRGSAGVVATKAGATDLLRMREEEKLARDVYTALGKSSNLAIFRNISQSENRHMQSIERLVRANGANGIVLKSAPGVFSYPDYQQLYGTLVAEGSRSTLDALLVGAKIEEMDIADLRQVLNQSADPQVRQVLQHLLQGSQNHLRAFATQIAQQGARYNAQFLTQTEFDQIAGSPMRGSDQGSGGQGPAASRQGGPGREAQDHGGQGRGAQGRGGQGRGGQGRGGQGRGGQGKGGQGKGGQGKGGQGKGGQRPGR